MCDAKQAAYVCLPKANLDDFDKLCQKYSYEYFKVKPYHFIVIYSNQSFRISAFQNELKLMDQQGRDTEWADGLEYFFRRTDEDRSLRGLIYRYMSRIKHFIGVTEDCLHKGETHAKDCTCHMSWRDDTDSSSSCSSGDEMETYFSSSESVLSCDCSYESEDPMSD